MAEGSFHDPYTGETFQAQIALGAYNVTNGEHVLLYETEDSEAVSHCSCPICSKRFAVDLLPGPDALISTDFESEYNTTYGIILGLI